MRIVLFVLLVACSKSPPPAAPTAPQPVAAETKQETPPPAGDPGDVALAKLAEFKDRSTRAIQNAKEICDEHLAGTYELDVIDIFQQPTLAKDDQILAVPTLIKKLPLPLRRFIGDLSDRDVVLVGLDLKRKR